MILQALTRLDILLFVASSIGGTLLVHCCLKRYRSVGVPLHAWAPLLVLVAAGWFLAGRAERLQKAQLQSMVEGFAPTYAAELQRMGHSRLTINTAPDDPLYLSMIEAQKRWLKVNPAVADIYTFRRQPDGKLVLMVDSETDYDHNGRYEGEREARTTIGESYEEEMGPAIKEAWEGKAAFDDVIATDRWGSWISAYVPMYDEAGSVEAVLGVDYPAEKWSSSIALARFDMLMIVFVLQAIWVGTSTAINLMQVEVHNRRRAEADLSAHQSNLERLVNERTEDLLTAQRQILQNEKLACVGQLAAGVAHEINTPVQYIGDNLRAISGNLEDLLAVDAKYRELVELVRSGGPAGQLLSEIASAEQEHDRDFVVEDTPKAIAQSLEGVERVTRIVRAMKDFSHLRDEGYNSVNINDLLQSTLTISRNEYKYVAELQTEFGEIPTIECSAGEIGQVLLNLIVNAGHAIADTGKRGKLTIRTRKVGDCVEIAVADTGTGIPEEIRDKVFDAFFTTKPVGKGTGQGLSIVREIVSRHGGTVELDTRVGEGTEFRICLPVVHSEAVGEGAAS